MCLLWLNCCLVCGGLCLSCGFYVLLDFCCGGNRFVFCVGGLVGFPDFICLMFLFGYLICV